MNEPMRRPVTDMPQTAQPEVKSYAVEVRRCERCGQRVRGQHPEVAPDQYGATAHRVGPRVKAAAHTVHYGMGVPVRKLPAILREFTGIAVTQSALTQDALQKSEGVVGNAYQEVAVPAANLKHRGLIGIEGHQMGGLPVNPPARVIGVDRRRGRHAGTQDLDRRAAGFPKNPR
jgi:hypothetical protein